MSEKMNKPMTEQEEQVQPVPREIDTKDTKTKYYLLYKRLDRNLKLSDNFLPSASLNCSSSDLIWLLPVFVWRLSV